MQPPFMLAVDQFLYFTAGDTWRYGDDREKGRSECEFRFFRETILSEAKRPQIQCLSLKGEFWICSGASFRMVEKRC